MQFGDYKKEKIDEGMEYNNHVPIRVLQEIGENYIIYKM
jgi:hypothetical protein